MDAADGNSHTPSVQEVDSVHTSFFPAFLYLCLFMWLFLLAAVVFFALYMHRVPARRIDQYKVSTIENKKKLGIRIYKL